MAGKQADGMSALQFTLRVKLLMLNNLFTAWT
jgi:hypothetical protein